MNEITDYQRTTVEIIRDTSRGKNPLYPLASLCADIGLVLEGVAPYFDNSIAPRELKLAVWEFALAAKKIGEWADNEGIPDGTLGGDFGDIGNQVKRDMANALARLTETASGLKVNLRELVDINKKDVETRIAAKLEESNTKEPGTKEGGNETTKTVG